MNDWRDLRDPRDRPDPRNGRQWYKRDGPNREHRNADREFNAHPASRLYRGYLNPDYTVNSLGHDPPAIKFPRYNGKSGAAIEPVSYSTAYNNTENGEARVGHVNEAFVESNNAINQEGKVPLARLNSDPATLRRMYRLAVDVEGLRVSYGYGSRATQVLKEIDLTLPKGQIYGLLGPSGCGKTTLLRCIVGRKHPTGGLVRVFNQVPGTSGAFIPGPGVGYMPQELTLYPEFTIYETLFFFGKLFGMSEALIEERIDALLKFLELPEKSRLVKNLSGGQQRRVSLAAALIHNPPLLILDEPTVGVDPLLRKKIWNYLVKFVSQENMTVIVTTHYIEEARQANIVGLMRDGRMLAQDSPDRLLEHFQCETLEDVFLQLCLADTEGRAIVKHKKMLEVVSEKGKDNNSGAIEHEKEKAPIYEVPPEVKHTLAPSSMSGGFTGDTERHETFSDVLSRAFALLMKNITRLKRNIPVLLFTFIVPSFQVVLFCVCIGADPFELPVAVVNSDVHPVLSQPFLESIPNYTIVQRTYSDLDQALASVERGETWGVINIGHNYSTALQYRFLLGIEADNDTIEESTIDIYMDMTNQQIGFILQKTIFGSFIAFTENLLVKMNKNVALAQLPVRVRDPVYGNGKPSFTEFMAPGIILSITYIMAVGLTAISIIMEVREGTMERCWVAGVKPLEVVVSLVFSQFFVMLVQVALLLVFIFIIFEIPLEGSLILVILLTLLQGLSGMTYGLMISSICSDEQNAMMLALGTFYPNLLLSGIIWPIQSMPKFVRYIAYGLPQTIPTESLRCIMYRGWGIEKDEVWLGFVVSIAWSFFFLLFATAAFKARN